MELCYLARSVRRMMAIYMDSMTIRRSLKVRTSSRRALVIVIDRQLRRKWGRRRV